MRADETKVGQTVWRVLIWPCQVVPLPGDRPWLCGWCSREIQPGERAAEHIVQHPPGFERHMYCLACVQARPPKDVSDADD